MGREILKTRASSGKIAAGWELSLTSVEVRNAAVEGGVTNDLAVLGIHHANDGSLHILQNFVGVAAHKEGFSFIKALLAHHDQLVLPGCNLVEQIPCNPLFGQSDCQFHVFSRAPPQP
jgi:hypothetical protein